MGKQSLVLTGVGVAPGIAGGRAVLIKKDYVVEKNRLEDGEINTQVLLLQKGLAELTAETEQLMAKTRDSGPEAEAAILEAHLLMLKDPALNEALLNEITRARKNAAWAVEVIFADYIQLFSAMDDEYMRQRSTDLAEIRRRLLGFFSGENKKPELRPGSIIVAEDLGPAETLALNPKYIAALVLEKGGRTSHTTILARALGMPAVIGVAGIDGEICGGEQLIVDANAGKVFISPPEDVLAGYAKQIQDQALERQVLQEISTKPAVTLDGRTVELWANVGGVAEAEAALRNGAQGIGLFRTEFLFMDRRSLPGEEEQTQVYREMLALMQERPVVIRTLDIGSDKRLPYFRLAPEENPALGCRAIRLCLKEKIMFRTQLRALLRASVAGNLWIMFPMIATPEELRTAKGLLQEARKDLTAEGVAVSAKIKVGMMVEVPAAAVNADLFASEVDFFSIGTNDLIQYLFAADRQNRAVDYLYQPMNIALLRLIRQITDAGHRRGIPVGICGEMAGDPETTAALIGLGLDELSMSAGGIPRVKRIIRAIEAKKAARTVEELIAVSN